MMREAASWAWGPAVPHATCDACDGSGRDACDECGASGEVVHECDQLGCRESHTAECQPCAGQGWYPCHDCTGAGTVLRLRMGDVLCPVCEGWGRMPSIAAVGLVGSDPCLVCEGGGLLQSAEGGGDGM